MHLKIKPLIANVLAVLALILLPQCVQNEPEISSDFLELSWQEVATSMPSEWYASAEAAMVGDSVLKYQTDIGGWAKNSGFHRGGVKQEEWARILKYGIGATFDNDATLTEIKFLKQIYLATGDDRYRDAFIKAYNYIFQAQYPNGGWPQFYPCRKGKSAYSSHITYNDDVQVNVMRFLDDVSKGLYDTMRINTAMKDRAAKAFEKGLECILNTQIQVDGEPSVWCAQHNEFTLEPMGARSYELPSFSGNESAGVTLLLMEMDNPSEEVIASIQGAVRWFMDHEIKGIRVETFENEDGERDRDVVEDPEASGLWARFYDLDTGEPFFCNRDGIKKQTMAEISINRRGGYNWYTNRPALVLEAYPDWTEKWGVDPV